MTPRFVPNLRVSADYLNIEIENAISSFSSSQVVAACYDAPDFPSNEFCQRVSRDDDGQLDFVQTSYFNAAGLKYEGILGAVDYRFDTPFLGAGSQFGVNATYQYLQTLETRATGDAEATRLHGTIGYPKHSAVLNLNWERGPLLLFTSINYTGEVNQANQEPDNFREFPRLDDVAFVNGGFAVNVADRMRFRFVVDNIFDTKPPFPVPGFGGAVTYFPGILGRFYRVGASVAF